MSKMLVYRCPGRHQMAGGTYDFKQVCSPDALEAAYQDGWFPTLPEAAAGKLDEPDPEEMDVIEPLSVTGLSDGVRYSPGSEIVVVAAPDQREEMESKAKELGVKFNARTSDEKLAERIEEAVKALDGVQ